MADCSCGGHPAGATRRDILRWGAAAAGLVALGPFRRLVPAATGSPQALNRLVVINLFGGCDTLNMFIPVGLQPYYDRRPNLAIPANEALSLAAGPAATSAYRLHPAMPRLAELWGQGKVAAVNRVGYPQPNLSHFSSQDIYSLGVRNGFAGLGVSESGWIARFADAHAPTPLGAVSVGVGRPMDFDGGTSNPFIVNSLASFRLNNNLAYPPHFHRLNAAKDLLADFKGTGNAQEARDALKQAHDLVDQVQDALGNYTSDVVYGGSFVEQRMRDIAVLVQGGFETRIFFTGYGGFDTHGGQGQSTGLQATRLAWLDGAVGAFADDMKAMGTWDRTVIAVITEFGRRNYVNGSDGTDHGHAYTALLVGGPVKGGVYGPHLVEADLTSEYPAYAVDFRGIYKEILSGHLGADPAPVFPEPLEMETTLGIV